MENERVLAALVAERGLVHVAGQHDGVVGQLQQLVDDAAHLLRVVAAGQVGAPDALAKERVAAEQDAVSEKGDAAARVPRRVNRFEPHAVDLDDIALGDEVVGIGRLLDLHPELRRALGGAAQDAEVVLVHQKPRAAGGLDAADAEHVVEVPVRGGDQLDLDAHIFGEVDDVVGLFAGVDADRLARAAVADHPAVFLECADNQPAHLDFVDPVVLVRLVGAVGLRVVGHVGDVAHVAAQASPRSRRSISSSTSRLSSCGSSGCMPPRSRSLRSSSERT